MVYVFNDAGDILIVEFRPFEPDAASEAWDAEAANGVEEAHELDRSCNIVAGISSECGHLRGLWRVGGIRAAVDPVNFLAQGIGLGSVDGSVRVEAWSGDAAVVDHSRHAADGEGTPTQPEHPYLTLESVILDNVSVGVGTLFGYVMSCCSVEEIIKKRAPQADAICTPD